MSDVETIVGILLEDACLTLDELARACQVEEEWIVERVNEGLFPPMPGARGEWRFTAASLRRARRMRSVERDFDAVPELAALVADLADEMEDLRARLRRMGAG